MLTLQKLQCDVVNISISAINFLSYSEFPESPGALLRFLNTLGTYWNISLFHYRSHGTDYGRVLAAFELGDHEPDFETRLNELGYDCHDETNNPAFRFFLAG